MPPLPDGPDIRDGDVPILTEICGENWVEAVFRGSEPGIVPESAAHRPALIRMKLIDEQGRARLRLNRLAGLPMITDGAWSLHDGGLFPWCDESTDLLSYVHRKFEVTGVNYVVDLSAGCGHSAVALAAHLGPRIRVVASDIEERASGFVEANARLAHARVEFLRNDVCSRIPQYRGSGRALLVGNFPHAPAPPGVGLPTPIAGGASGADVTRCCLESLARSHGRADVVLATYSVANEQLKRIELVEAARELFDEDAISWSLLSDARIWRISGRKAMPNPMPLEHLPAKASCRLTIPASKQEAVSCAYEKLASALIDQGWRYLCYGLLRISR